MLNDKLIEQAATDILANNDLELLAKTLNSCYQEGIRPNIVSLLRYIRTHNFTDQVSEETIVRKIIDTTKDWNKGVAFTQNNIIQLLFQSSSSGKLVKTLYKILISDIKAGILNINKLVDDNLFLYIHNKENEELALFILENCDQDAFQKMCSHVIKNPWLTRFIQLLYQNQSHFKFPLPSGIIALKDGAKNNNVNIVNINIVENKQQNLPTAIRKETPAEKLSKLSGTEYVVALEKYIDESFSSQDDFNWDTSVIAEYRKIFDDIDRRFQTNKSILSDVSQKDRMLKLAFKYQKEEFASHFGMAMNASINEMAYLAIRYKCTTILANLLKDKSKLDFSIKNRSGGNLLHQVASSDLKTIKTLIAGLGPEIIKKMINEKDRDGDTPVHYIIRRDREFDDAVKLFAELGGDFKIKNKAGLYPSQLGESCNYSKARLELFKSLGVTNLKSLHSAIVDNDLEAVKINLAEKPEIQTLRELFYPPDKSRGIKVPVHRPLGGSMLHSKYRTYISHAIYFRAVEIVKLLIDQLIIANKIFDPQKSLEIIDSHLNYTKDLIDALKYSDEKVLQKYREIQAYLEKVKLSLDNSITNSNDCNHMASK